MTEAWVCPKCGGRAQESAQAGPDGSVTRLDDRYALGRCLSTKPCSKDDVPLVRQDVWERSQEDIRTRQAAERRRALLKALHKGTIQPGDKKYADALAAYKEVNGDS